MPRYEQIPEFLKTCPEIELPLAGARGWMIEGSGQQVVFVEFSEAVSVPEHSHAEQWEFAIAGRVEMTVGGETRLYQAGDNFYIPEDTPHFAMVHAGYQAMMVFNSPDRYKAKRG